MSKNNLKRILYGNEIPKLLNISDCWNICGRNMLLCIVRSHLKLERKIHYLCYSMPPSSIKPLLSDYEGLVNFYDFYDDPLNWKLKIGRVKSFLDSVDLDEEKENVLVVDKLTCAAKLQSMTDVMRNISELNHSPSLTQAILLCSEDVMSHSFMAAVGNLCSCSLTLRPIERPTCDILIKKKSGSVIKSEEEFEMNSSCELIFSRDRLIRGKPSETQSKSEDTNFETTFNLSLTEDEKEARKKVVLPHTRIQNSSGRIHYIPDEGDDWDDEDPDEDLEI